MKPKKKQPISVSCWSVEVSPAQKRQINADLLRECRELELRLQAIRAIIARQEVKVKIKRAAPGGRRGKGKTND